MAAVDVFIENWVLETIRIGFKKSIKLNKLLFCVTSKNTAFRTSFILFQSRSINATMYNTRSQN